MYSLPPLLLSPPLLYPPPIFHFFSSYSQYGTAIMHRSVPPVFFQLVGQFFTFCITNFFPLYYAYKIDRKKPSKESEEKFVALLECAHFRYFNNFFSFLYIS
jgi:hypothetical protein